MRTYFISIGVIFLVALVQTATTLDYTNFTTLDYKNFERHKHEVLNVIESYKQEPAKRRIYLLSYPRSGNSLTRYAVEYLTDHPTMATPAFRLEDNNYPYGFLLHFPIDLRKEPIWKTHNNSNMNIFRPYDPNKDRLIFILRNPKETLIRNDNNVRDLNIWLSKAHSYFENLKLYDTWNPENKILLHYEDLLSKPRQTFKQLCDFMGADDGRLDGFVERYTEHRKACLWLYTYQGKKANAAMSQGQDLYYHSQKVPQTKRQEIDVVIKEKYPYLWQKYLYERYAEGCSD